MIHPRYYGVVFLYVILIITIIVSSSYSKKSYNNIKNEHNNTMPALGLTILLAFWIGLRPSLNNYNYFGDSFTYFHLFNLVQYGEKVLGSSEWIWDTIMIYCANNTSIVIFFVVIALGYFLFTFFACRVLTPNNVMISLLFMFGALSFYSYGVNGIRNGLACSVALLAISLFSKSKKNLLVVLFLVFIASGVHKTTLLPIGCMFVSAYIIKSFKQAYSFWILSIIISLAAGGAVTSLFAALGFDDRLSYLTADQEDGVFSHSGFRWDFLIYSMMPIVLGYYVIIKRGIQDRTYSILLNTYTLANAFWVMVIRASYSNRFAYLSWFMYPIVLAYPLLCLDIWGNEQGKRLQQIMLAHIGFTWFMTAIFWS